MGKPASAMNGNSTRRRGALRSYRGSRLFVPVMQEKRAPMSNMNAALTGKRIAVVEDNFIVRSEIETALEQAGATVVSLFDALIDGAILDVLLEDGTTSLPVALELQRRCVAFLFYTGQPDSYPFVTNCRRVTLSPSPRNARSCWARSPT